MSRASTLILMSALLGMSANVLGEDLGTKPYAPKTPKDDNKYKFTSEELDRYRSLSKKERKEFLKKRNTSEIGS